MSLADSRGPSDAPAKNEPRPKTLSSAIALLNELRPRIMDILGNSELRVALRRMDIMRPDRGDVEQAHVMWAGPSPDDEDTARLKRVAGMHTFSLYLRFQYLIISIPSSRIHQQRISTSRPGRRREEALEGDDQSFMLTTIN